MVFKFKKKSDKDKSHYISAKESREIARKNARRISALLDQLVAKMKHPIKRKTILR